MASSHVEQVKQAQQALSSALQKAHDFEQKQALNKQFLQSIKSLVSDADMAEKAIVKLIPKLIEQPDTYQNDLVRCFKMLKKATKVDMALFVKVITMENGNEDVWVGTTLAAALVYVYVTLKREQPWDEYLTEQGLLDLLDREITDGTKSALSLVPEEHESKIQAAVQDIVKDITSFTDTPSVTAEDLADELVSKSTVSVTNAPVENPLFEHDKPAKKRGRDDDNDSDEPVKKIKTADSVAGGVAGSVADSEKTL